jgi:hypothetical protein
MSGTNSHKMTVIQKLLAGGYISLVHGCHTLFEGNQRPVLRLSRGLYRYVDPILKKHKKKDRFLISLRAVQRLHGKHAIKKAYKQLRKEKSDPSLTQRRCAPCLVEHILTDQAGRGGADMKRPGEAQLTIF